MGIPVQRSGQVLCGSRFLAAMRGVFFAGANDYVAYENWV